MDPLSLPYLALLGATVAGWWLVREPRARALLLAAGGIVYFSFHSWLPLAVFGLAAAITLIGLRTRSRGIAAPIIALAALLIGFKAIAAPWFPKELTPLATFGLPIGISYYVLRSIATLVESSRNAPPGLTSLETFGFLGFAPILTLGPIERASSFVTQMRRGVEARVAAAMAVEGVGRIVEGLFKTLVLGEALARFARPFVDARMPTAAAAGVPPGSMWGSLYAYSLYLYVNFSGASDLAIGASRLLGLKITENFDLPYARPNLSEFWRAWHISLSTWLRDFLFFPIAKRLPRATAPIVAPLIVMGLCGLWHGLTIPFLVWGLLHGAGLSLHQIWTRARRASAGIDRASGSLVGRTLFTVLTAHYVAFTWVFFAAPSLSVAGENLSMLASAAPASLRTIGWGAALVALWSFAPDLRAALRRRAESASDTLSGQLASLWRAHVDVVLLLVVAASIFLQRHRPEGAFVYQGF